MGKSQDGNQLELIVAALLRRRRYELGMPQQKLVDVLGSNRKTVGDLESGRIKISLTYLARVCPILKIEIPALIQEAQEILNSGGTIPTSPRRLTATGKPTLPSWLSTHVPEHLRNQHAAIVNQLRRRNQERDLEDSPELCEADEG